MKTKGGKPLPNATRNDHQRKRLSRPTELLINRPPPWKLSEQRRQDSANSDSETVNSTRRRDLSNSYGETATYQLRDSGVFYSATNTSATRLGEAWREKNDWKRVYFFGAI
ncbi:hypothetical protein SESBI_31699 [Sesbania bispinosa]|nr:hypothetical protein SESBI_31699 [Sesbania bispinosa]